MKAGVGNAGHSRLQSNTDGGHPRDLFALVDAAEMNAGELFGSVLANSGFSDYETLRAMAEDRDETSM
jgi:hypothetical protein